MTDFLMSIADWPVMEVLFVAAVVLVLIDYFFPVDFPAYFGYLCFAGGMFFALPYGLNPSIVIALLIFALLLTLHKLWFTKFLTNAYDQREAG